MSSRYTTTCIAKRPVLQLIDEQIIRSSLNAQNVQVRLVDHGGMYADAMTKKDGNIPLLQTMMRSGRVRITEETFILEKPSTTVISIMSQQEVLLSLGAILLVPVFEPPMIKVLPPVPCIALD